MQVGVQQIFDLMDTPHVPKVAAKTINSILGLDKQRRMQQCFTGNARSWFEAVMRKTVNVKKVLKNASKEKYLKNDAE